MDHQDTDQPLLAEQKQIEPRAASIFSCPICTEEITDQKKILKIPSCTHSCCEDCLTSYIENRISNRYIDEFPCPVCRTPITREWILQQLSGPAIVKLKKYEDELKVLQDPNLFFCPNLTCDSVLRLPPEWRDIKQKVGKLVQCPRCDQRVCLNCFDLEHPGQFCFDPRRFIPYLGRLDKDRLGECPGCSVTVYKTTKGTCPECICLYCKTRWCWLCNFSCGKESVPSWHYSPHNPFNCNLVAMMYDTGLKNKPYYGILAPFGFFFYPLFLFI